MFATKTAAASFVKFLQNSADRGVGRSAGALTVGLYGNLGAGKTTFTQEVARRLGIKDKIISPTFVIMRIYPIMKGKTLFRRLIHIDAYRLESAKELNLLGFKELLRDRRNLIIIEWADKVSSALPKYHLKIFFEFVGRSARKIYLSQDNQ